MSYGIAIITTLRSTADPAFFDELWEIASLRFPYHSGGVPDALAGTVFVEGRMPVGTVLLLFAISPDTETLLIYDTLQERRVRELAMEHVAQRTRVDVRWLKRRTMPSLFQIIDACQLVTLVP